MPYTVRFSCYTHVGRVRKANQDNFLCDGQLEVDESGALPLYRYCHTLEDGKVHAERG